MMRKVVFTIIGVGLVAVIVIGLTQTTGTNSTPHNAAVSSSAQARALRGSPPPLQSLHADANRLLGGGTKAVETRLASLKGYPVIVNVWASWCGPCRYEFPFLQRVSVRYGTRVAFLGLNAGDNEGDARRFLKKFPVSYPSYTDPNYKTVLALHAPQSLPSTLFFDRAGKVAFVHQGAYPTRAKLEDDVRRYALRSS